MTIDIKKSWFEVNWNKPKKIKRHIKRYQKKYGRVYDIKYNSRVYGLEIPKDFEKQVDSKCTFYYKQISKLKNIMELFKSGKMAENNKTKIIDEIFLGKHFWQLKNFD